MAQAKTIITEGTHNYTDEKYYVAPESEEVRKHLEWFRGLKLGFMVTATGVGAM